jgi:hypothetical protein
VLDTCTVGIPKGDIRQVQQAGLFVGREGRNQIAGLTRFMDKPQLRIAVHIQFNEWQQCYVQVTEVLISAEFNAPSVMFIFLFRDSQPCPFISVSPASADGFISSLRQAALK